MSRKFALKSLTSSDLTLFKWHFQNQNAGNQKAINLNANVFTGILYPTLPNIAESLHGRIPLDLYIFGPGLGGELNLQRKIVKHGTYKNWRLNGEFIENPLDDPNRFNVLERDDVVLIEFIGNVTPNAARAVFVAAKHGEDKELHAACTAFLDGKSMKALAFAELRGLIDVAQPDGSHPIHELVLDADLEDAAFFGSEGTRRLLRRRSGKGMSRADLQASRTRAEESGDQGEGFANDLFSKMLSDGVITTFTWVSAENAIAPYDFTVVLADEPERLVDAKSTRGEFERRLHISMNEIKTMAEDSQPYDLYRIYEMTDNTARLRICRNMADFANTVLTQLEQVPQGVTVDSISVDPSVLNFDDEIELELSLEDD